MSDGNIENVELVGLADATSSDPTPSPEDLPHASQTPLYHALQASRYSRQEQIRAIEKATGRRLILYIAQPNGIIDRDDVLPLVDLLQDVDHGDKLDLMLHSPGGDVDAAEKIVLLIRKTIGPDGEFHVVVPDSAKSAGTLIAMAADAIVMGDSSELGPIDPQITITTVTGETMTRPARSFLDGLERIITETGTGPIPTGYLPLLEKYDPALIDFCEKALLRSRKFAKEFLTKYMLRDNPDQAEAIAARLNDPSEYLSHGAVVDCNHAKEIGLNVRYLPKDSPLLQAYWRLYCEARVGFQRSTEKLFESRKASLLLS